MQKLNRLILGKVHLLKHKAVLFANQDLIVLLSVFEIDLEFAIKRDMNRILLWCRIGF
jgi:hypothetical protein